MYSVRNFLFYLPVLLASMFIASCGPTEDDDPIDAKERSGNGLIILNEGGFQRGNASMSFLPEEAYTTDTEDNIEASTSVFEEANGTLLGDVGHSMTMIGEYLYVVVNNSGLIRVLEPGTFKEIAQIKGFNSPRYIVPVDEKRAYVSDLYSNFISIVHLESHSIIGEIPLRGMTEKMLVYRHEVYVANNKNKHIFTIDIATDSITDSIDIGGHCNELHLYKAQVAAVRNAHSEGLNKGAIVVINTLSHTLSTISEFDFDEKMWYARSFAIDNGIYVVLGQSVFEFKSGILKKLFEMSNVTANNISLWNGNVWISNAKDYQQKGVLQEYSMTGELLSEHAVGTIPSQVLYYKKPD